MPLIQKPNYNQIFASQAPEQDKPAVFNNYPLGWGVESRPNNGKPTIKGFNYLQQTSDLKDLWILQNGACLPYDESIEYAEGSPVLKDGVIQYKVGSGFKSRDSVTIPTYSSAADGVDPVTGVAEGAYFNVRSEDDDTIAIEYQNVGGSAVATGKRYLSALGVEQQEKPANTIRDASGRDQQEINSNSTFVVNPLTDDNFKAELQHAVSNYKSVLIRGTHQIDLSDAVAVVPADGCSIYFDPNAKITVNPNALERFYLFDLNGVKDVSFWSPTCIGDKHSHTGTLGQWGHCFNLENCENINIYYPKASEFWGDGIYVKRAKNVKIFNPQLTDNRRQGLSIISCDGMEVFYPQFTDTSGQAPAYGIDIEPNWNGESTKGLKIYNPTFRNNGTGGSYQTGMAVSTHRTHLPDGSASIVDTVIDVEIFNPKFYGDALLISAYNDTVKGSLIIHNPEFYNARRTALYFINHQSDNFKTIINNPKIYDAVSLSGASIYDNPITFECTPDAVKTSNGTQNVEINNPEIYASDTAGSKRMAIRNVTPNTFPNDMRNVAINNLKVVGFTAAFSNSSGSSATTSTLDTTFKLTYSDQSVLSALSTGSSITLNMERFANIYTATTLQGVYYLADDILINDSELYYSNLSPNNLAVLMLRFGSSAAPTQAYVEGLSPSKLTTGVVVPRGSFVRLRKLASDRWLVVTGSPNITTVEAFGVAAVYDPPSLAAVGTAGDTVTTTVTVTGAAVGNLVQAAFNRYNAAIEITASVSATNTVTVKFKNTSASAVDLPSGTITVKLV